MSTLATATDRDSRLSENWGDVNHDGFPDFVLGGFKGTTGAGERMLTTYLGQADGSFVAMDPGMFMDVSSFALVDVDGDGNLDLSTTNPFDSIAFDRVAAGRGDGTFEGAHRLLSELVARPFWTEYTFALPGDFDGDSDLDIAVGATAPSSGDDVLSLFSNVDGMGRMMHTYDAQFRARFFGGSVDAIVADVNVDSRDDAVWCYEREIWTHAGLPNGTFAAPVRSALAYRASGIFPANLNNDALPDLIVAVTPSFSGDIVGYHGVVNDGTGRFLPTPQQPLVSLTFKKSRIAVADFDGDGLSDIADADPVTMVIGLWRGLGGGAFAEREFIATLPREKPGELIASDINNDGNPDLYFHHWPIDFRSDLGLVVQYVNNGAGIFTEVAAPPIIGFGGPVVLVDLDRDDLPDEVIVLTLESPRGRGSIRVRLGRGPGAFGPPRHYPVDVDGFLSSFADINGDSWPDLVGATDPGWPIILFNQLGGAEN
jgi:hypothetical protein